MTDVSHRDHLLTTVSNALHRVAADRARAIVASYDFQDAKIASVLSLIRDESDRSISILLFALAEDLMLVGLKYHMRGTAKGGWEKVTAGNGVLATASDRIAILELLGWLEPGNADELRLMKSIRNRFAHHADVSSFTDNKIRGWLSSMKPTELNIFDADPDGSKFDIKSLDPRNLFILRALIALSKMVNDLAVLPAAYAQHVSPADVVGPKYEDQPEGLRQIRYIFAEQILNNCFPQARHPTPGS